MMVALTILGSLVLAGCGPMMLEEAVEVKPDETAFKVSIEDTGDQGKFASIDFLEKRKVATTRVLLDQRKRDTGRMWWSYEWIPTERVIVISRALCTRDWSGDETNDNKIKKLQVESLDSVGFNVGASMTCRVEEKNAATFLYNFAGKQLEQIMDTNIRGYCQKELMDKFGRLKLEECKRQKTDVFKTVEKMAKDKFEPLGITVDYFGAAEGLTFDDKKIQDAINRQVQAESDIETARQEKLAQDERNKTMLAKRQAEAESAKLAALEEQQTQETRNAMLVSEAEAKARAAKLLLDQKEALLLEAEIYQKKTMADARLEAAKNLKEIRILPADSGFLMDLDK